LSPVKVKTSLKDEGEDLATPLELLDPPHSFHNHRFQLVLIAGQLSVALNQLE